MGNGKPLTELSGNTVLIDDTKTVMVILVLALQAQPQTGPVIQHFFLR